MYFFSFEGKEAMEVIEAVEVIMADGAIEVVKFPLDLEFNNLMARISLFWCFKKKNFWVESCNFKFSNMASFRLEAVEDRLCHLHKKPINETQIPIAFDDASKKNQ